MSADGAVRTSRTAQILAEDLKEELIAILTPHYRDGSVWIKGAAWFVTARNPA